MLNEEQRAAVVEGDILSCPAHPDGAVDGCAACDDIIEVWTDQCVAWSKEAAADTGEPPVMWHPSHKP